MNEDYLLWGRIALNTKTNMYVMEDYDLVLTPDPGDGGSALGAAVIGYISEGRAIPMLENAYLGYDIENDNACEIVTRYKDLSFEILSKEHIVEKAASDLAEGKL